MKAYEKAKQTYPALSKTDLIENSCPHLLGIAEIIQCSKFIDLSQCEKCWNKEVEG